MITIKIHNDNDFQVLVKDRGTILITFQSVYFVGAAN